MAPATFQARNLMYGKGIYWDHRAMTHGRSAILSDYRELFMLRGGAGTESSDEGYGGGWLSLSTALSYDN